MGHARIERDRRSSHRVDLDGRAVLFQRGDSVGQYTLHNISAGGAMVSGERDLRPGHLVHLLIDLERGEETMSLTGSVRRVRDRHNGVGVASAVATRCRHVAPPASGLRTAAPGA
ncbi:MAG: PilZ domain-containing protein [Deltaproteobacteria bacterium]|nr:PilZ domain-containing protein [Deltaproteobacteria bacterium]